MAFQKQLFITAGTVFAVPIDWRNDANKVECVGESSAAGFCRNTGTPLYSCFSGAAGAYAASTNLVLAPGSNVTIAIGTGGTGTDTCFGGSTLGTCTVGAQAGQPGSIGAGCSNPVGGLGGQASASVGQVKFSGGSGQGAGTSTGACASGGGAAGPNGNGASGFTQGPNAGVPGGAADNGTVAGGAVGGAGLSGTEFDATHGSGSGGGANTGTLAGGNGGSFGGGPGAASQFGGTGAGTAGPGLIVVSYTPLDLDAALLI